LVFAIHDVVAVKLEKGFDTVGSGGHAAINLKVL
jgi:hypothetical protein